MAKFIRVPDWKGTRDTTVINLDHVATLTRIEKEGVEYTDIGFAFCDEAEADFQIQMSLDELLEMISQVTRVT